MRHNIAIFASGSGTNAENLAQYFKGNENVNISVVLVNKPEAGVIERMKKFCVQSLFFENRIWAEEPQKILEVLEERNINIVILAGFLRKIHPSIVEKYNGRMVNIHPSLLPLHGGAGMYGMRVHNEVLASGDKQSGATVHFVSNEIDGGEIIDREIVEVRADDDAESLAKRVHGAEYIVFPRAINKLIERIEKQK